MYSFLIESSFKKYSLPAILPVIESGKENRTRRNCGVGDNSSPKKETRLLNKRAAKFRTVGVAIAALVAEIR